MSNGLSARQHLTPAGDVGGGLFIGRGPGDASLGHQQIGGDILDPDHAEAVLFEDAADAGQQMIVAAPERRPDPAEHANGGPVEPDLRQRRPHQRADENQIAAVLAAKQFDGPADLADRDPVMAKARHGDRIAGALQREQHGIEAARDQGVRDRERHDAAGRDHADRR